MFSRFVREDNPQSKRLSEMLMQLKSTKQTKGNSPETAQLIQEIDSAIESSSSKEVRQVLEESGLSSEEIASLLTATRLRVAQLSKTEHFLSRDWKRNFQRILHKRTMILPPDFSYSPFEKQAETVTEMMKEAINLEDEDLLLHHAKSVGERFDHPPADLVNYLKELRDTSDDSKIQFASRTFLQYLE